MISPLCLLINEMQPKTFRKFSFHCLIAIQYASNVAHALSLLWVVGKYALFVLFAF